MKKGNKKIKGYLRQMKWLAENARPFTGYIVLTLLLSVTGSLAGVGNAVVSKNLLDNAVIGSMKAVIFYAALFVTLIITNLGLGVLSAAISVRTLESLSNSIRLKLFSRISRAEWEAATKYHSGDVLTRLTSDVGVVAGSVVNTLPGIITLGVQLVAAFCIMLHYEPYLALLAFILGPLTVLLSRFLGRKLKHLYVKVQESESAYRSFIQESLQNLLIVKAFRMEKQSIQKIENLHQNRMKWVVERNKTSIVSSSLMGLGYWTGYFLAFCWGALKLNSGAITFGTLTAFLQLIGQLQAPFFGLSRNLPQVISAIASTGRLMELENLPVEKCGKILPEPGFAGVSYQRVSFSYRSGEQPVLEKVSFNIRPGETVALMGPSGEGKTTLIRILLAFLKPSGGKVMLTGSDGMEYGISAETRDWISYVPQGNTLFSGTIAENIWYGKPEASLEELLTAAQYASAMEFISELGDGLNTVIGEHGIGLSEGQAQRIAIARALLRRAPILILDEATSALDLDSEIRVLQGIRQMQPQPTCIVITHRPSALKICSRIFKLKDGRLVEAAAEHTITECAASA